MGLILLSGLLSRKTADSIMLNPFPHSTIRHETCNLFFYNISCDRSASVLPPSLSLSFFNPLNLNSRRNTTDNTDVMGQIYRKHRNLIFPTYLTHGWKHEYGFYALVVPVAPWIPVRKQARYLWAQIPSIWLVLLCTGLQLFLLEWERGGRMNWSAMTRSITLSLHLQ